GYGCMRFPRKNGRIDEKRTEEQIITAIEEGVNYFDTAYTYPGSEKVLGKILKKGYRTKVKIATKIPIPSLKNQKDIYKIFEEQLKRLQTDYIDYYLIHNICTIDDWEFLESIGIIDFIKAEKEKCRIINIGFSFHGNIVNFKKVIDSYDWDFCMIQYNYLDEQYQAGSEGLEYAQSKGIGIIAMEPLRGGMLVDKLPQEAMNIIENFKVKRTPAEWALRWVGDNPNISVVLSGMNNEDNIKENIKIFSDCTPNSLNEEEKDMLHSVKEIFQRKIKINCTNCGYCLPCPRNVDIPLCFSNYNDKMMFGQITSTVSYLIATMNNNSAASNCTNCGVCAKKCPQNIAISKELKSVDSEFNKWYYRAISKIVMKVMFR
ncbi:aldo/keto reductase, partial [Methanobrevibacter sp. OttesenSCG-928-K11]|nr:aldo/keto reductase [Methanobrevibacter sp. OttesenSCG-928-K11]